MGAIAIGEALSLLMFFAIIGVLLLGFPVAFTLPGVALIFALIGWFAGAFDPSNFSSLAPRYLGTMLNDVLVAVPLFIFMGSDARTLGDRRAAPDHDGAALSGSCAAVSASRSSSSARCSPPRPVWSARRS